MKKYDVIIIGSGPGGLSAAYGLAERKKVLVVEKDRFGGTCPNRGCDPKKLLYTPVNHHLLSQTFQGAGLKGTSQIDWPALMAFKKSYTDKIDSEMISALKTSGIDTIRGTAVFQDAEHIVVNGEKIAADNFIIAAGAKPAILDIPGKEYLTTSADFLELPTFPKRIGIIGSGFVGMELMNLASALATEVHVFQRNQQLLPQFPAAFSKKMATILAQRGVHFHWDTEVQAVEKKQTQTLVAVTQKGARIPLDMLVSSVGRPADLSQLNLQQTKVETKPQGIVVNEYLQTAEKNIYAIGDVVAKKEPKLTPVSHFEGDYVAQLLLGKTVPITYPAIPNIVYTTPQIAQTGISVKVASQQPDKYQVKELDVSGWYNYFIQHDTSANIIIITEKATGLLKGAAVLSFTAEALINLFTLFINQKLPAATLHQQIFLYPSQASDLPYLY